MQIPTNNRSINRQSKQRGSVLVISMLILLAMTLVGLTSLNSSMLEERMATNTQKKTFAFQDADAVIAYALQSVAQPTDKDVGKAMVAYENNSNNFPIIDPPTSNKIKGTAKLIYEGDQIPIGYSMDKFTSLRLQFVGTGKAAHAKAAGNFIESTNIQGATRNAPKL